jgi:HlyD family secretion protein
MKWTYRIAVGLVTAVLIAVVFVSLRPRPVVVDVVRAVRAPLEQKIVDDGRARVRERYTVSALVSGTLGRIDLHEGDVVEPGAVLARVLPLPTPLLDPESKKVAEQRLASAVDAAAQARATVERADAAMKLAKSELGRSEALTKEGAVPTQELERATVDARMRESELASAKFASLVAEHGIAEQKAALERYTPGGSKSEQLEITSPVHGQVLHVLRKSEGVVEAGTPLLEIGDADALELVADVLSQDAVGIRPGMPARVVHWGGDGVLEAKVRRVEPAAFTKVSALGVEEQRVNVLLDLEGAKDHPTALGDGFALQIEITTWSKPDALQVPSSALFRDGDDWAVFVADGGSARRRHVEPGHRGQLATEILSGLSEGDAVIIHPGAAVKEGVGVEHR